MPNNSLYKPNISTNYLETTPVVDVAQWLLGKILCRKINNNLIASIICETEAYNGIFDKACHAFGSKKTPRTLNLYKPAGTAYVYLCYGIHQLLNVVTQTEETPNAVLLRGAIVIGGQEFANTNKNSLNAFSAIGPGKLSRALHIGKEQNGIDLCNNEELWMCDIGIELKKQEILVSPKIGIEYAQEDALLPYRFYLNKEKMQELFETYKK